MCDRFQLPDSDDQTAEEKQFDIDSYEDAQDKEMDERAIERHFNGHS